MSNPYDESQRGAYEQGQQNNPYGSTPYGEPQQYNPYGQQGSPYGDQHDPNATAAPSAQQHDAYTESGQQHPGVVQGTHGAQPDNPYAARQDPVTQSGEGQEAAGEANKIADDSYAQGQGGSAQHEQQPRTQLPSDEHDEATVLAPAGWQQQAATAAPAATSDEGDDATVLAPAGWAQQQQGAPGTPNQEQADDDATVLAPADWNAQGAPQDPAFGGATRLEPPAGSGYGQPQASDPYGQPGYGQQPASDQQPPDPYGQSPAGGPYGQASGPYGQSSADPYAQQSGPYTQTSADPYAQQGPYTQPSAAPYGQPSAGAYGQQPSDPYANQYGQQQFAPQPYGAPQQGFGQPPLGAPMMGGVPLDDKGMVPQGALPSQVPPDQERSQASTAHWLGILLGWLGPLIIMLTNGEKSPWVKQNAREALNFEITLTIGYIVSYLLMIVGIGFITWPIIWIVGLIFHIMGAQAASKGQNYKYPFAIRFLK